VQTDSPQPRMRSPVIQRTNLSKAERQQRALERAEEKSHSQWRVTHSKRDPGQNHFRPAQTSPKHSALTTHSRASVRISPAPRRQSPRRISPAPRRQPPRRNTPTPCREALHPATPPHITQRHDSQEGGTTRGRNCENQPQCSTPVTNKQLHRNTPAKRDAPQHIKAGTEPGRQEQPTPSKDNQRRRHQQATASNSAATREPQKTTDSRTHTRESRASCLTVENSTPSLGNATNTLTVTPMAIAAATAIATSSADVAQQQAQQHAELAPSPSTSEGTSRNVLAHFPNTTVSADVTQDTRDGLKGADGSGAGLPSGPFPADTEDSIASWLKEFGVATLSCKKMRQLFEAKYNVSAKEHTENLDRAVHAAFNRPEILTLIKDTRSSSPPQRHHSPQADHASQPSVHHSTEPTVPRSPPNAVLAHLPTTNAQAAVPQDARRCSERSECQPTSGQPLEEQLRLAHAARRKERNDTNFLMLRARTLRAISKAIHDNALRREFLSSEIAVRAVVDAGPDGREFITDYGLTLQQHINGQISESELLARSDRICNIINDHILSSGAASTLHTQVPDDEAALLVMTDFGSPEELNDYRLRSSKARSVSPERRNLHHQIAIHIEQERSASHMLDLIKRLVAPGPHTAIAVQQALRLAALHYKVGVANKLIKARPAFGDLVSRLMKASALQPKFRATRSNDCSMTDQTSLDTLPNLVLAHLPTTTVPVVPQDAQSNVTSPNAQPSPIARDVLEADGKEIGPSPPQRGEARSNAHAETLSTVRGRALATTATAILHHARRREFLSGDTAVRSIVDAGEDATEFITEYELSLQQHIAGQISELEFLSRAESINASIHDTITSWENASRDGQSPDTVLASPMPDYHSAEHRRFYQKRFSAANAVQPSERNVTERARILLAEGGSAEHVLAVIASGDPSARGAAIATSIALMNIANDYQAGAAHGFIAPRPDLDDLVSRLTEAFALSVRSQADDEPSRM